MDGDGIAERLGSEPYDLVVVGGGIIGTGVAWIAARAGLRVVLCERDDLAAWTSSASSKLIHGGLRYLRMGDVKLVREAHTERRALARIVAPHLVRPLRFVMPLRSDGPYGPVVIGAGMVAYGALSGFRDGPTLVVAPTRAHTLAPGPHDRRAARGRRLPRPPDRRRAPRDRGRARSRRLRGDDRDALRGRRPRRPATAAPRGVDVRTAAGEEISIRTRAVVNATGPWVDTLRQLEDARAGTSIQLSKGAHLVLETDEQWPSAVTVPLDRVRVSFALPYNGMLVLGTTDEPYEGDPAAVSPNDADQERILAEAGSALRADVVDPSRVRYRFAGLRALPLGAPGETASTRREMVLSRGPGGMLSVAGGKYTTFRRIALEVVRALAPELGLHALDEHPAPLADAVDPERDDDAPAGPALRPRARARAAPRPPLRRSGAARSRRSRSMTPSCSSRCIPRAPISPPRSCGHATPSGPSRSTTSCAAAARSSSAGTMVRRARPCRDAARAAPAARSAAPHA